MKSVRLQTAFSGQKETGSLSELPGSSDGSGGFIETALPMFRGSGLHGSSDPLQPGSGSIAPPADVKDQKPISRDWLRKRTANLQEHSLQFWKIILYCSPDNGIVNFHILVHDEVSHVGSLTPWDVWILCLHFF